MLDAIGALESERDPKCHATASRLEDFMYGTPLTDSARWMKNAKVSNLAHHAWRKASEEARTRGEAEIDAATIREATSGLLKSEVDDLSAVDLRQYGSVAFGHRATLRAWQDSHFVQGPALLPLASGAVHALKSHLDTVALTVLSRADHAARAAKESMVQPARLEAAWALTVTPVGEPKRASPAPLEPLTLARAIAKDKVASYEAYNEVNNQLFVRNLQVHFARRGWPKEPDEQDRLRGAFMEALIAFAGDLFKRAGEVTRARGGQLIEESDVHTATQAMVPFSVDIHEDVTFFPRVGESDRVWLEAYDLDAFRDSGVHWRYLTFAWGEPGLAVDLDIDPFAVELLTESVAQVGVLMLRIAGDVAEGRGSEQLKTADLAESIATISRRSAANRKQGTQRPPEPAIASAPTSAPTTGTTWFQDVTSALGVEVKHRSSDWLSRLLRSYLKRGDGVGEITIPPAFGGSGVAAGDVDGDGWDDLLVLSGGGNRLYRNVGGERFEDITTQSGLQWRRAGDRQPGEPRQPLIADLDNDGNQDIIITYVDDDHRVYRGLGKGRFEDVTERAGLGGKGLVAGPATLADFDGDGLLDLYIVYFGHYTRGVLPSLARHNNNGLPNHLFHNRGGFRFQEMGAAAGVADTGWGQAVTHTDLDADGRQDLIVGNDFGVNRYYRNVQGKRFEDITAALRTGKPSYTMGLGIADLNSDLRPDVYVSNIVVMNKDEKYVSPSAATPMKFDPDKLAHMRVVEANDLFVSGKSGYTQSQRVDRGYAATGWSWGADFVDVDLDGDEDLYVLNGMNDFAVYGQDNPYYTDPKGEQVNEVQFASAARDTNAFFVNEGGRLNLANDTAGLGLKGNSRSALWFDYDRDGDLDVAIHGYHERLRIMRNDTPRGDGRWLMLKLTGDPAQGSNRDAIGAKIIVGLPDKRLLWREVRSTGGYLCGSPRSVHLGLGAHTSVALTVLWPGGQRQQTIVEKVDSYAQITQGSP